jgi:lysophospholipid acyltransferase
MAFAPGQTVTIGPLITDAQSLAFLGCLLSSYLFSWLYYHFLLHSWWPKSKQFYLAAITQIFLFIMFPPLIVLNIYVPIIFTYLVVKHYRHKRWMPLVVFCGVLGHLALVHLHRQFLAGGEHNHAFDQSGPLMFLMIKLTTFAFDIGDAYFAATGPKPKRMSRRKGNEAIPQVAADDPEKEAQLISLQSFPTALEFAGYAFLFPGFMTGPAIPFYEYRCFVDGSYFAGIDATKGALTGRKRRALKQFLIGIFFMLIYAILNDEVNLQHSLEPEHLAKPIWYRMLYLHVTNLIWRSKYYFIWLVAEGSYVMIGLGFRKHSAGSHKVRWDRCENVNVNRVELAYNFKQVVSEWNVSTNQWLYSCVYKRIADWQYPGRKPGFRANLATYVVSAIWHVLANDTLQISYIFLGILSRLLHHVCVSGHVHIPIPMYKL